jgi:hypothetical protein
MKTILQTGSMHYGQGKTAKTLTMVSIFLSRARLALIFLHREDEGWIRWECVEAKILF